MEPLDLDRLLALAAAAPAGPYKAGVDVFDSDDGIEATVTADPITFVVTIETEVYPQSQADWARAKDTPAFRLAAYIAACDPATVTALVARLRAAEAEVKRLAAENKRLADDVQEWYAAHRSRLTR